MSMIQEVTEQDRERWKTKADHLLSLLRERPRTTQELITQHGHRFSASKRVLVERGYQIERSTRDDGQIEWALVGYEPRVEVTEQMKAAYYITPHWRETRRQRIAYDRGECVFCGFAMELEVHHWRYDLFNEDIKDLSTCCEACHVWIHENKNVSIHFPHFVTPEIAARLAEASP